MIGASAISSGMGHSYSYAQKVMGIRPQSLVAYWPLWDTFGLLAEDIGPYAMHGQYLGGILGGPGIGDGNPAAEFNVAPSGTAGQAGVTLSAPSLGVVFSLQHGTILCWLKPSTTVPWNSAQLANFVTLRGRPSLYYVTLAKGAASTIDGVYRTPIVFKDASIAGVSGTGWLAAAVTWSKSADQLIVYVAGTGSAPVTGLGTWLAEAHLSPATTGIGLAAWGTAGTTSSSFCGQMAHCVLWNDVLTAAEIASLSSL